MQALNRAADAASLQPAAVLQREVRRMPTRRNGGFTLIEIMVVVFILGLLAALVVPRFIT